MLFDPLTFSLSPEQLRRFGGVVALHCLSSQKATTFDELATRVEVQMSRLERSTGALCILHATPTIEFVVNFLSLMNVGVSCLLVDENMSEERLAALRTNYRPDFTADLNSEFDRIPNYNGSSALESVLLGTSGSTGSSKYVRLSRLNIESNAKQIAERLRLSSSTRSLAVLKFHYSYGLSVLTSHLSAGSTLILTRTGTMSRKFVEEINENNVNSLAGVPYSYQLYSKIDLLKKCPNLTDMTQAGGRLEIDLVEKFHNEICARGGRLWIMYGQTEATARISILEPELLMKKFGSVGRALSGSEVKVSDPDATGQGELILKGPQVMLGYAENRSQINGSDDCVGVLRTGDLGRIDEDGHITVLGRLKRIGKVFGERVNLDELEQILRPLGSIAALSSGDRVVVFIEESTASPKSLSRQIESTASLPPRSVETIACDKFPRLSSGKIDYQRLGEML